MALFTIEKASRKNCSCIFYYISCINSLVDIKMIVKRFNVNKLGLVLLAVVITGGLFYWFQLRPAQIKHDCSWVKQTSPFQPAVPPMNEEELFKKGIINDCSLSGGAQLLQFANNQTNSNMFVKPVSGLTIPRSCEEANQRKIEEYKNGKPAIPSKEWWIPASEDEYKFCLHDKGL